jgi:hypothetical protein
MQEMTRIENQIFLDEYIYLGGLHAVNCNFSGCILVAYEDDKSLLTNCILGDCVLTGDGWPESVQELMNSTVLAKHPRPEKGKIV